MRQLYNHRLSLLIATVLGFGFILWLLAGDVLRHLTRRWPVYQDLGNKYGNWFAPDRGISGLMGIIVRGFYEHLAFACFGLAAFAGTIVLFIAPQRNWSRQLMSPKPLPQTQTAAAALVAGLVTVGFITTGMELAGWWSRAQWPIRAVSLGALTIMPTFWIGFGLLLVSSCLWYLKLRRPKAGRDRMIQMIVIIYATFLGGALLLLTFAILMHFDLFVWTVLFDSSGIYTGAGIGFSVMLWTLIPALVLVYKGERYRRIRDRLCLECEYDLRGIESSHCPECGARINPKVYAELEDEAHGDQEQLGATSSPDNT